MPGKTCDYESTSEELPAGLDGWSCGREVWTDADQEPPAKCIWHTEQYGKPTDGLLTALKADWESNVETEPWARRLDGAVLKMVNLTFIQYINSRYWVDVILLSK